MRRISFLILVCTAVINFAFAQTTQPILKSSDKGFYIEHKVAAKENFYSIGRLYNVSAKEIAAFNKLDMAKGLSIAQVINIPLSVLNFSQTINSGTPVYYETTGKESLAKVSTAAGNVSLENLRRWNNLKGDNITVNKLVVGFLVSSGVPVVTVPEKKEPVTVVDPGKEKKPLTEPGVIKKEPIEVTDVKNFPPVQATVKTETAPVVSSNEGFFKSSFEKQSKTVPVTKSETVTAGIFKTASGWQDGKYYLLMDGVQSGTIIRIINPGNNKMVYAKVLGEMNGIRQNEGLSIRISNSAASALQVSETDKFIVKVNY